MARQIKVARDTAVKARSAAIITLKTLIVNAPSALREDLDPLTDRKLIDRCHRLKPGEVVDTRASTKHALRAIAARWIALTDEIDAHDVVLDAITLAAAPTLRQAFGIGPDSAAEMMIVAGDNPTRIRSESAFAKLCGVCPIPASSGVTNRHRLFRGGHRQANAGALSHRHRPHALASTDHRLRRPQDASGPFQEGHPPLSEAIRGPARLTTVSSKTIGRAPWSKTQPDRQVTFLTYRGVNARQTVVIGAHRQPRRPVGHDRPGPHGSADRAAVDGGQRRVEPAQRPCSGRLSGRRHATLPQSWIQRENWEFETHRFRRERETRTPMALRLPGFECGAA